KPLRMHKISPNFYGVSGSPADCVFMGVREVMKKKVDLVVSGINRGANLGQDVHYSGTVSAAREACMMGLPALAVSLVIDFAKSHSHDPEESFHFKTAARWAVKVIKKMHDLELPNHTLLNLNVPNVPEKRVKGLEL